MNLLLLGMDATKYNIFLFRSLLRFLDEHKTIHCSFGFIVCRKISMYFCVLLDYTWMDLVKLFFSLT